MRIRQQGESHIPQQSATGGHFLVYSNRHIQRACSVMFGYVGTLKQPLFCLRINSGLACASVQNWNLDLWYLKIIFPELYALTTSKIFCLVLCLFLGLSLKLNKSWWLQTYLNGFIGFLCKILLSRVLRLTFIYTYTCIQES